MDIVAAFQDHERMTRAMALAVRDAIRKHKALGVPIVIWKDGAMVTVAPEDIVIPEVAPLPPRKV